MVKNIYKIMYYIMLLYIFSCNFNSKDPLGLDDYFERCGISLTIYLDNCVNENSKKSKSINPDLCPFILDDVGKHCM